MRAPLCPIIRDQSRPAQPRYNVATSPHGLAPRQALVSVKRVLQRLAKPIDLADSLLPDDACHLRSVIAHLESGGPVMRLCAVVALTGPGSLGRARGRVHIIGGWAVEALCRAQHNALNVTIRIFVSEQLFEFLLFDPKKQPRFTTNNNSSSQLFSRRALLMRRGSA
jgi:hypothetical protein